MSAEIGRKIEIGVALETTRNTPKTTATKWVKNISSDFISRSEKVTDENSRGRLENSEGARIGKRWFEGDIEGNVHADAIGYFLANIYGSPSSATATGTAKNHTFTLSQSIEKPTLTFFRKDGSIMQKAYGGGVVENLEISVAAGEYVKYKSSVIASNENTNADTPTYGTEYDFISKDVTVKIASTLAGLAGATATKVKSVSIKWDPSTITDYVLGNQMPDNIYNGAFKLEASFNRNNIDTTFEDLNNNETYSYMQISIVGAAVIGTSSNPAIVLTLNRAQVTDWSRSGKNDDLVEEDVTVTAFFNQTDTAMSSVVVTNLTASY